MRIVQAYKVYRPEGDGGVPEVMSQIATLNKSGDDVSVLVAREQGFSRRLVFDGTPVTAVFSLGQLLSMPLAPGFPLALWRAARHCDILALHAPFPLNDLGLALGVPDRVAVVLHWHAEVPRHALSRRLVSPIVMPLVRHALERADRIIVSDRSMIEGSEPLQRHADKCVVIPYGSDVAYWQQLDDGQRRAAEALRAKHPRLVVATGRLVPYKGYPVLLEAMQAIDGELVIIGDGDERDRLVKLAHQLGVADRVIFRGFLPREEMKLYYHAARVFVLASVATAEAFGIVQIEAMASGLPVVNTSLPTAVPMIARNGIEGFTVKPGDAVALARAVNQLLHDPALSKRMSEAATLRANGEYSRSTFLARIRDVYAAAHAERVAKFG